MTHSGKLFHHPKTGGYYVELFRARNGNDAKGYRKGTHRMFHNRPTLVVEDIPFMAEYVIYANVMDSALQYVRLAAVFDQMDRYVPLDPLKVLRALLEAAAHPEIELRVHELLTYEASVAFKGGGP